MMIWTFCGFLVVVSCASLSFVLASISGAQALHSQQSSSATARNSNRRRQHAATMGLKEDFDAAAERIKPVTGPNHDEMLELYSLFKQATVGDNTTPKPGMLDLKGKRKWDAWTARKGVSADEAMRLYIELVAKLVAKYAPELAAAT